MFDYSTQSERAAIETEQVRAYFKDANDLNLAGALVYSLQVYVVYEALPWWTWAPALFALYVVTFYRAYLFRQYRRTPANRNSAQWENGQVLTGGLAGVCWGLGNTAMLANLPLTLQLFVLTVAGVVAATSTSEGFSLVRPSRAFVVASLILPVLWLLTVGDRLHSVLALMLMALIALSVVVGKKRNQVYIEAQQLRLQKELLVQELSKQYELVEQASMAKSRFLAAASHDLRQPLGALTLFLDMLAQEQGLTEKGRGLLDHAQQASTSLNSLLNSLLDISRFDAHVIKPVVCSTPIQRLFDSLQKEFGPIAEQEGIRLHFAPSSAAAERDPVLLDQILRNLISNALRYTPSGRILVGCRRRGDKLSIEVHDTGIGIAEEHLGKIFDEFYQVNNKVRDRQKGLGLGLSIVNRAARLLGHSVSVKSAPGKGSCFSVAVPVASRTDALDAHPPHVQQSLPADISGRVIAVLEDEPSLRMGMQNLLELWGCKVVAAGSVSTMIEQLETGNDLVDLIISDFGLSDTMNGIDAIAALRQHCKASLPALLITGNISKEVQFSARDAGLTVLHKPVKPAALRSSIAAAFGN
jgi:signal transduction histidine kinase